MMYSILGPRIDTSIWGNDYRYQGVLTQVSYILFALNIGLSKKYYPEYIKYGSLILIFITIFLVFYLREIRTTGLLGNPNFTGGYIALTIPFLNNWWQISVAVIAIWTTGSRSAMIAVGIMFISFLGIRYKSKVMVEVVMLGLVIIPVLFLPARRDLRNHIWSKGLEAVVERPFLGYGIENFEIAFGSKLKDYEFDLKNIRVDKAHNEFLEIAINSGITGLFFYIILIIAMIVKLRVNQKVLLALVAFIIVSSLNVVSINEYMMFYLAMGAATTTS